MNVGNMLRAEDMSPILNYLVLEKNNPLAKSETVSSACCDLCFSGVTVKVGLVLMRAQGLCPCLIVNV